MPKEDSTKVSSLHQIAYLQNELESSFIYEDDQTKSTAEVSRYGE
jgi:hypothetical protein